MQARLQVLPSAGLRIFVCILRLARCARRALVVRRFQSLSVQDICQFVIVGLLTGWVP